MEGDHTVASVGGGERLGVVARGGVAFAVPHVGQLVLANALVILCGVALLEGYGEDAGGELIAGGGGHDDGVITRSDGDGLRGFAGAPEVGDFHVGGGGQFGGVARANAAVTGNVSNGGNDAGGGGEGHCGACAALDMVIAGGLHAYIVGGFGNKIVQCPRIIDSPDCMVSGEVRRGAVLNVPLKAGPGLGPVYLGRGRGDIADSHVRGSGALLGGEAQYGAPFTREADRTDGLHVYIIGRSRGQVSQ